VDDDYEGLSEEEQIDLSKCSVTNVKRNHSLDNDIPDEESDSGGKPTKVLKDEYLDDLPNYKPPEKVPQGNGFVKTKPAPGLGSIPKIECVRGYRCMECDKFTLDPKPSNFCDEKTKNMYWSPLIAGKYDPRPMRWAKHVCHCSKRMHGIQVFCWCHCNENEKHVLHEHVDNFEPETLEWKTPSELFQDLKYTIKRWAQKIRNMKPETMCLLIGLVVALIVNLIFYMYPEKMNEYISRAGSMFPQSARDVFNSYVGDSFEAKEEKLPFEIEGNFEGRGNFEHNPNMAHNVFKGSRFGGKHSHFNHHGSPTDKEDYGERDNVPDVDRWAELGKKRRGEAEDDNEIPGGELVSANQERKRQQAEEYQQQIRDEELKRPALLPGHKRKLLERHVFKPDASMFRGKGFKSEHLRDELMKPWDESDDDGYEGFLNNFLEQVGYLDKEAAALKDEKQNHLREINYLRGKIDVYESKESQMESFRANLVEELRSIKNEAKILEPKRVEPKVAEKKQIDFSKIDEASVKLLSASEKDKYSKFLNRTFDEKKNLS